MCYPVSILSRSLNELSLLYKYKHCIMIEELWLEFMFYGFFLIIMSIFLSYFSRQHLNNQQYFMWKLKELLELWILFFLIFLHLWHDKFSMVDFLLWNLRFTQRYFSVMVTSGELTIRRRTWKDILNLLVERFSLVSLPNLMDIYILAMLR